MSAKSYKTIPIKVILVSNAMTGVLSICLPTVGGGPQKISNALGLVFDNAQSFNELKLESLKQKSPVLKDLAENSKQVEGSLVLTFSDVYPVDMYLQLPTVLKNPARSIRVTPHAFVQKIELYSNDSKLLLTEQIEGTPSKPAREGMADSYVTKLARSMDPNDFDIRGIKPSMTIAEIEKFAQDNKWSVTKKVNVRSRLIIAPHGAEGQDMSQEPSGSFRINVLYVNDKIESIVSKTKVTGTPAEVSDLILKKYGLPCFEDQNSSPRTYGYGCSLSDEQLVNSNTRRASDACIFKVSVSDIINPSGASTDYYIDLSINIPQAPIRGQTVQQLPPAL